MDEKRPDWATSDTDRRPQWFGLPSQGKQFLAERIGNDTGQAIDAAREGKVDGR